MNEHIKNICKVGQGLNCCRYLIVAPQGFECTKYTTLRAELDFRVATGTISAQSDNCDGYPKQESILILNETKKAD